MENKQSFGRFICEKRKAAGLTQQQLADMVYVTESAVSKWERGLSYPDITMIPPLCQALGVSERELITASDDKRTAVVERDAARYRRMRRGYLLTTYILYGCALLSCAAADLADGHGLSWSFIVLTSLALAFTLTDLPLLLKTHRAMYTLFAFFAVLNLLVLTCNIYYGCAGVFPTVFMALLFGFTVVFLPFVLKGLPLRGPAARSRGLICLSADTLLLFGLIAVCCAGDGGMRECLTKAFPTAAWSIIPAWLYLLTIRYARISGFFKTSVCLGTTAAWLYCMNAMLAVIIDGQPFRVQGADLTNWQGEIAGTNIIFITVIVLLSLTFVSAAAGIVTAAVKARKS